MFSPTLFLLIANNMSAQPDFVVETSDDGILNFMICGNTFHFRF